MTRGSSSSANPALIVLELLSITTAVSALVKKKNLSMQQACELRTEMGHFVERTETNMSVEIKGIVMGFRRFVGGKVI